MSAIGELNGIAHLLPLEVLEDINKRITDWLASGGQDSDPYIEQQLRFALRFVPEDVKNRVNERMQIELYDS